MTTICLNFVLAAIVSEPQPQPESMLPTPADWRFERIDFPLSFAPELTYEGFEELRFAPGMFTAESETYFTYIFGMKITNDAALDAAELKSLLETYYRGLCRAVAKDKKFDIDVSKISAQVRHSAALGGADDGVLERRKGVEIVVRSCSRGERICALGGEPFTEFQLPEAVLKRNFLKALPTASWNPSRRVKQA